MLGADGRTEERSNPGQLDSPAGCPVATISTTYTLDDLNRVSDRIPSDPLYTPFPTYDALETP